MMHRTAEFLRSCGTFYIATCDHGQPRVRPFGALAEFENKLYLVTSNKKPVFAQLTQEPRVEICGMNAERKWIRVAGTAVVDARREAKEHMLAMNPSLGRLYSVDDGVMEVFYLKDVTATINSYTSKPETLVF